MAAPESKPLLDVLTLDKPEQLKALGHPLRLRVLETLGAGDGETLTNRELASRLDVDPGHLHFHVRMLLRAGLIELADTGQGREKPYRAVARTVRVAPALLKSDATSDLRAAMLDEVQRLGGARIERHVPGRAGDCSNHTGACGRVDPGAGRARSGG